MKEIVTSVRTTTKSKLNGIAGTPQDILEPSVDTEAATDYSAPLKENKYGINE